MPGGRVIVDPKVDLGAAFSGTAHQQAQVQPVFTCLLQYEWFEWDLLMHPMRATRVCIRIGEIKTNVTHNQRLAAWVRQAGSATGRESVKRLFKSTTGSTSLVSCAFS